MHVRGSLAGPGALAGATLLAACALAVATLMTLSPPARARLIGPPLSTAASHARPDVATPGVPQTARGPVLWTSPFSVDGVPIDGIACPSAALCVAVDRAGGVLWSTDATGGAQAWHYADVDGANELTGVSCPSASLCVAVDAKGNVASSTDPTAGTWSVAPVDANAGQNNTDTSGAVLMRAIACPSTALCVAVDAVGDAFVSSDPSGGSAAWGAIHADADLADGCAGTGLACQPPLVGISCPSIELCEAIDFSGNILSTSTPTAPAAWASVPTATDGLGSLWGVSCPTASFCATVNGPGQRVMTFDPYVANTTVTRTLPEALDGIWCPSRSLCLASAETGGGISGLAASTDPSASHPTWTLGTLGGVNSIGCLSSSICIAADDEGNVAAGVTTQAVGAALRSQLLAAPRRSTRRVLARTGIDRQRVTAAIAGEVTLAWTQAGAAGRVTTLASATHRFIHPGTTTLALQLTSAGVQVLRSSARRVTLTATATFLAGNGALTRTRRLTFTRPAPVKKKKKKR